MINYYDFKVMKKNVLWLVCCITEIKCSSLNSSSLEKSTYRMIASMIFCHTVNHRLFS